MNISDVCSDEEVLKVLHAECVIMHRDYAKAVRTFFRAEEEFNNSIQGFFPSDTHRHRREYMLGKAMEYVYYKGEAGK